MADLQLHELRAKLVAVGAHAQELAKDLATATEECQQAEYDLAVAKVASLKAITEKSRNAQEIAMKMETIMEEANAEVARLKLRLVLGRIKLFEQKTTSLQSAGKTFETEARLA
jgi:hypothetical protein